MVRSVEVGRHHGKNDLVEKQCSLHFFVLWVWCVAGEDVGRVDGFLFVLFLLLLLLLHLCSWLGGLVVVGVDGREEEKSS